MSDKNKEKEKVETNKEYPYLDLLSDNSPQAFEEYYEDAAILNKQIREPNVYNIAVVAKYGAGKSSVITTYLKRYRNRKTRSEKKNTDDKQLAKPENNKYTRISLSTFNKNDYDEVAIERSILQQLLYSRKKAKLPNSKIERTNKSSKIKSVLFAVLLTVFLVSTALMGIEFSLYGRDASTAGATSLFGLNWIKYALLGISTSLLFLIVLWVLHFRKLKKIKYKDLEADITQDDDKHKSKQVTNLINKFIDEVLYFFECIDIDLVIFEDLDRLPTTEIFVKLRELNTIINSSSKSAKKVTFLYAVKDELFKKEEERAKFFEFILPVVPVINPVTTKSEIESRLKELTAKNHEMNLTGKLIKGISTYIPDMRILKNTFNDYIMMFHKIFEDKNVSKNLKADNLFAVCLYKNLFPYDYALLEKNDGLIPLVIDINSLQKNCLTQINDKIKELDEQLAKIQNEAVASFDELKGIFISQLFKYKSSNTRNGSINPWTVKTFEDLDFSRVQHPYVQTGSYNYGYAILLENGTEVLTPKGERFIEVENLIRLKEQKAIEKIKKELAALEKQRQQILSWGLAEFVSKFGLNSCFSDDLMEKYNEIVKLKLTAHDKDFLRFLSSKYINKIDENIVTTIKEAYETFKEEEMPEKQIRLQISFLRFLVAQNYIDEHYIEYTSNYKAEILSPADIKIVQNIQSRQINFNALFENVAEVARWLDEDDFSYSAIISKTILDNITIIRDLSMKENDKKFSNLLTLLADADNQTVFPLIQDYFNIADDSKCDELLKILIPIRNSICSEIISSNKLSKDRQDFVLVAFIKYSKSYETGDKNDIINEYVRNYNDYLNLFSSVNDDKKVEQFLDQIKPKFVKLDKRDLNKPIQKYIIDKCLYELTLENLAFIFDVDKESKNADFYTKNYGVIFASDNENVKTYIEENLNTYISQILLNTEVTCENESIENMLKLLTNEQIGLDHKEALLVKIKVEFENINVFDSKLYAVLFANDRINPTWKNIQIAYELKGFGCVKDFIIRNKEISGGFVGLEGVKQETPMQLINSILIELNEVEMDSVARTMHIFAPIGGLTLSEINDEVLSKFISLDRAQYHDEDLSLLIEKPKSLCEYIIAQSKDIIENFENVFKAVLPQSCFAAIIGCNRIDMTIKRKIIAKFYNTVKIDGYELIYADYVLSGQAVPNTILWQFSNTDLEPNKKYRMLEICNYGGNTVDLSKLKEYLMSTSDVFKNLFGAQKDVTIEKTVQIKKLLDILSNKKLIIGYKKARNKEEYSVRPA